MQPADWSDYQAFLAIARHGQLARAAQASGVNATTMGRRLRRLEARLGTTLFEQTREGQQLTDAGEVLLVAVEGMALAAAAIEPGAGKDVLGRVRISVSEGLGSWIIARHLGAFARAHPGLSIDLVASNGFLNPSRREADLAILLSRPKAGPLVARKLPDYTLQLYAGKAYLADHPPILGVDDLRAGHQFIGYIPDLLYAPELDYLADFDPAQTPTLRSSSILAQHRLLASDAGVGVLPSFIGDSDPVLQRVLPDRRITRSFWLVSHKDNNSLRRIRIVTDWLVQVVKQERHRLIPAP